LNKAKWILRSITICCILIPLLVVGYTYRDNLLGLIVPPQLQNLINQNGQNNSNVLNSTLAQLGINPNVQPPQFENLTYDSSTGIATLTLNFTNPLTGQSLEVSNFSLTVAYSNGAQPVTIQLVEPINIAANQTGEISIPLTSSDPQALQRLISGNQTINNLQLSNLYVNVNGITVQIGNLNGLFQSNNGNGNNGNNGNGNNNGNNNGNGNNGNNGKGNNNGNNGNNNNGNNGNGNNGNNGNNNKGNNGS
jgi:hypothetical protein